MHQGLPWGSCRVPQCHWPADQVASYFQETHPHADAWVHAASSTAPQLPWWWLPLLNNGSAHGAREEQQIFFAQPKAHQLKFTDTNKMVPVDLLKLIAFFGQCQATNKAASVLEKITKDKKEPKEKKTAHLPIAHSCELSYQKHRHHRYRNNHWSNQCNCDNQWPDYCHWDDWHHDCPCRNDKVFQNSKSYVKKDDCKHDHFKKKSDEAMHNDQSSLLSADTLSGRRHQLSKPIRLVAELEHPLTEAWFLCFVCSWEQRILRSSARSTAHVFPLGYAHPYKICVCSFVQLGVGPSCFSIQDRHLLPASSFTAS